MSIIRTFNTKLFVRSYSENATGLVRNFALLDLASLSFASLSFLYCHLPDDRTKILFVLATRLILSLTIARKSFSWQLD